ncbi:amidohydrolase [Paraburkholderia dipogonis]|uniref:Amidohydrolase n=1 Tax=Paraburkholderia dipogonis TaxID=1211383 RepID=A0A4Y8MSU7_9BURK|nr:M20 family metallopeptidase [Paraburkholderia dipogonis]TFE40482.1 amidohydrolase [Paraburkholderia dipogonis]
MSQLSIDRTTEVAALVDAKKDGLVRLSDEIWGLAETRWQEFQSVEAQIAVLEREGFRVTRKVGGIPTAFSAQWGDGGSVIGFLGEYDALSEMSQVAGAVEPMPACDGASGHGCGHHLLGAGAMLAAIATRDYLARHQLPGIVRYYGCPAEEGGAGKTYMARANAFDDVDAALTWHPGPYSGVFKYKSLAVIQMAFRFTGIASHAAASPHLGRSALDAVELMNVGVNFMREHMPSDARVHYAITDAGGYAPNVVQANAEVLYVARSPNLDDARQLAARVEQIGRAAALMTDTQVSVEFDRACSNVLRNSVIERLMADALTMLGAPPFDEIDQAFASEMTLRTTEADVRECIESYRGDPNERGLSMRALALHDEPGTLTGSSDVGDVSWIVPTAQHLGACYAIGTNMHTWQLVAQGKLPAAHKGMVHAAKVMAVTAVELCLNPAHLDAARAELAVHTGARPYVSPIPPDVLAPPVRATVHPSTEPEKV